MKRYVLVCVCHVLFVSVGLVACLGSTGGRRSSFAAFGAGPADATKGEPLRFSVVANGKSFAVSLESARVQIQALYLSRVRASGTQREDGCYAPAAQIGEVRADLNLDAIDPSPQPFSGAGVALELPARAVDVWLGAGPIEGFSPESARTVAFSAAGKATRDGKEIPFRLAFTIDRNRQRAPQSSALPGSNPICTLRIVDQIEAEFLPSDGGRLLMRVNPRTWFAGVDFDELVAQGGIFVDAAEGPSTRVFDNMRQNRGVYAISFEPQL
jgi:hypothetical protein